MRPTSVLRLRSSDDVAETVGGLDTGTNCTWLSVGAYRSVIVGHCAWVGAAVVGRLLDIVRVWELMWWDNCWTLCVCGSCCGGKIVVYCACVRPAVVGRMLDILLVWELL